MSGGGASSMCYPGKWGFLYLVSRSSLNTLWIIYSSGSSSWNASWLMFFEILQDLYLFWSSFFEGWFEWIFLASNHMLFPAFNPCEFCLFLSNYLFIASFTISIDFVAFSQLYCSPIRNSSNFGNSVCTVRFSFYRCLLKLSLKGVLPVAICFLSLYWNSATASHSI